MFTKYTGSADGGDQSGTSRAAAESPAGADRSPPVPGAAVEGAERLRSAGRPRPAAVPSTGQFVRRVVGRGRRRQHGRLRRRAGVGAGAPAGAARRPAGRRRRVPHAATAAAASTAVTAASRCPVRTQRRLLATGARTSDNIVITRVTPRACEWIRPILHYITLELFIVA